MKFKCFLYLAVLLNISILCANKTIFVPRSITHDATYELSLSNYDIYHHRPVRPSSFDFAQDDRSPAAPLRMTGGGACNPCCPQVNLYGSYFFQKSNESCDIGSNFFNCDCNCASLGQSCNSAFSIMPFRRLQGVYLQAHIDAANFNCCRGWWLDVASAFVSANHYLGFTDCCDNFTLGKLCKTGFDDIQVKLGYNYYYNPCLDHVGLYLVATIPTGKCRKNKFIFEPFVGSRNAAFGIGLNVDRTLFNCCGHSIVWMADLKYRYLFRNCEPRSVSICNIDCRNVTNAAIERAFKLSGSNYFTQSVTVNPRSTIDFWTAAHYRWCDYNFEFGYNLWWRQNELVECIQDNCDDCPVEVCEGNTLTTETLDFSSASGDRGLTHKIYGAFAYTFDCCNVGSLIGLGLSYEFAQCSCNTFNHFGVWAKVGVSF